MALDLQTGDILVWIDDKEYPIRYCGSYEHDPGSSRSMRHMCRHTVKTKRPPEFVDKKRGNPTEQVASMKCTPMDPVTQKDVELRGLTNAPYELKQVIVDGGDTFYQLFVEVMKKKAV